MAGGRRKRSEAGAVQAFLARLPAARRQRMQAIRRTLLQPGMRESVIDATLVLQTSATSIRVASRARHIGVYFPAQALLDGVRARHPELRCGSRSVSIRDDQYLPLYELQRAALRILLPQATCVESGPLTSRRGAGKFSWP